MLHHMILIANQLKSAWNFLFHLSFFANHVPCSMPEFRNQPSIYQSNEEVEECAVCLCEIEEGEEIRELICNHLFHRLCLDTWAKYKHAQCPLCRDYLVPFEAITELGMEVLTFKLWSFSSGERDTWWLR
ncbi:zf-RING_2 domain-containing protein [Cephalotus follicularis]|uniref:Zf-RING_2 domain-containing protein n=1 Tax=Cephalotus follicularis TaxID=3775 RepID=A0A1Q3CJ35_CEPFO|nr:zf-RING_2 domain-containing protein [Cephalotus follicularis]